MHDVDRERNAADLQVGLQAVTLEDTISRLVFERCQFGREKIEIGIGEPGVAPDVGELDGQPERVVSRIISATSIPRVSLPSMRYFCR